MSKPTTQDLAGALLAIFEGPNIRLAAYQDSGGVWTIGRGHTGPEVVEGLECTYEQAMAWLASDEAPLFALLSGVPTIRAAALASFGFNCGRGALKNVLAGADAIDNPRHTTDKHGIVQPGLVARRRLEKMLIDLA
jgi:lysozyme